jgi:hypothetical protein
MCFTKYNIVLPGCKERGFSVPLVRVEGEFVAVETFIIKVFLSLSGTADPALVNLSGTANPFFKIISYILIKQNTD